MTAGAEELLLFGTVISSINSSSHAKIKAINDHGDPEITQDALGRHK